MTTPYGEVRVGRQNSEPFLGGNYVDYTERTLGSVVNSFGVPSRYDGDIGYVSPRIGGLQNLHLVGLSQDEWQSLLALLRRARANGRRLS